MAERFLLGADAIDDTLRERLTGVPPNYFGVRQKARHWLDLLKPVTRPKLLETE